MLSLSVSKGGQPALQCAKRLRQKLQMSLTLVYSSSVEIVVEGPLREGTSTDTVSSSNFPCGTEHRQENSGKPLQCLKRSVAEIGARGVYAGAPPRDGRNTGASTAEKAEK